MEESESPQVVIVKNTFLDLDDGPRLPVLQRYKSTPAKLEGDSEDEDEDEEESDDGVQAPPEGEDVVSPPAVPELYRIVTVDGYEPVENWSDLCPPQQMPVAPATGNAPAAGGYGMPDGMVPVPVTLTPQAVNMMMQPGVVAVMPAPAMLQPGMAPATTNFVPMQRFDRWPGDVEGIPAPPASPAPVPAESSEPRSPAPDAEPKALPKPAPELPPVPEVARPEAPRPPALQRVFSVASSIYRVHWTVDARVLRGTDREKVSPPFDLSVGGVGCEFKMVIRPAASSDARGGHSFKKAKGKGTVELRCLNEVEPAVNCSMTFRFAIGRGKASAASAASAGTTEGGAAAAGSTEGGAAAAPQISETIRHDFAEKAICGHSEKYDFSAVVDEASQTFVMCLEVLASTA
eukprot:TRINITY_DN23922_c0_g1_i2.p1 TRINITY_DN23922_c0_g1~~TRINITY_DN23922_c0_g1_i2.p1  ORF type:complete len:418 (+),score=100.47 TRINITY_DN23922_c0_g1_i2:43-1254(+)